MNLPNLVALAQGLRAAQPSMLLTYPGGVINANFPTVDPQMATLAKSLDRFNIQSYYPTTAAIGSGWDSWFVSPLSGVTGSTPIAIDDTLSRYVAAGIPPAKLGMGTAFYAICYSGGITGPTGRPRPVGAGSPAATTPIRPAPSTPGGAPSPRAPRPNQMRDTTAAEPYLSFSSRGGRRASAERRRSTSRTRTRRRSRRRGRSRRRTATAGSSSGRSRRGGSRRARPGGGRRTR